MSMYTKMNDYKVNPHERTFQDQKENISSYLEASSLTPVPLPEVTIYPDFTFMEITSLSEYTDTHAHTHLLMHIAVHRHLDCFPFLAVVNTAAQNIVVHVPCGTCA